MTLYNKSILSLLSTVVSLSTAMAMEQQPEAIDYLSALPDELKVEILSYLPASEITNVSEVNKNWNAIAKDDVLWKNFCTQANLDMSAKTQDQTWEEFYKDELRPVPVRFSIQKPNQESNYYSYFSVNFMGDNYNLYEDPKASRLRMQDLITLTKDKVRKNYGCMYSVVTPHMRAGANPLVYFNGLKDVSTTVPEKNLLISHLPDIEAFVIILSEDCKQGDLACRFKEQPSAKS